MYIYIYNIYGAKHSLIMLNIKKCASAKTHTLEVFDSKQCDDCSVDIKFLSADQNLLWRRIVWHLHFGLVLLKLLGHLINFMCFF